MKPTPPKRRVLTAREKLMLKRYTSLVKIVDAWQLYLSVDCQSFHLWPSGKRKSDAVWLRDMLAIALAKIEL